MSKKEDMETQAPKSTDKLKSLAKQVSNYMNQQYKQQISYTPNQQKRAAVKVSEWLEMPDYIQEGLSMPGLPFGQITQVYGKKDSGKTSLLMQGIAEAQKQDILPILILTEHKFDFDRLETFMEADPEAMLVLVAEDLEEGFRYLERILRDVRNGKIVVEQEGEEDLVLDVSDQKVFVFWDSIGGTLSAKEADGDPEDWDKDMGRSAQALKKMVKRSVSLLRKVKNQVGVLFLNQVWGKRTPMGVTVDQPVGGEAVQHYYAVEIHLKKANEAKMTFRGKDMGIGYNIKMDIKKNHVTHNRPKSAFIAVAEGLIEPNELNNFKTRYKKFLKEG